MAILFFWGGSIGVWTQGFVLAKQVLYRLNHTYRPLAWVILETGSEFLHRLACVMMYFTFVAITGMTNVCYHAQFFFFLTNFITHIVLVPWSFWSPLHSLGWQVCITLPSYWLRWGSYKVFAWAVLEPWSSQSQSTMYLGLYARLGLLIFDRSTKAIIWVKGVFNKSATVTTGHPRTKKPFDLFLTPCTGINSVCIRPKCETWTF
jgi:hypothetical protein